MVVYEVNLSIDNEIYRDYKDWLDEHILEMLKFPGFLNATVMHQSMDGDSSDNQKHLTVQYQLESTEDLQNYFEEHAPKMRGDGMNRFKGRFTATRRTFEVEAVITAANKYVNRV
ncbi:TPA: DUF4286 family protein [Legionella pneumophila]|nr:DUF4286 family protein [Legionella pneumophila]HAT8267009.1 DUF4286 family protein [Legionella pneumophila]HAT8273592.1 DUF4286 family protein [Legionella pneumophila]HDO7885756.1 DUF4286 family protein [Legionella pneumophila]